MSKDRTSVADRNQIIDLKLAGHTLGEIAAQTGWSLSCVRQWWRAYRDGGRVALTPRSPGPVSRGVMSHFPEEMRDAFQQIKLQHPGWGAAVARLQVAEQLDVDEASLPATSTIEKYWRVCCPQQVRRYQKQPPPPVAAARPTVSQPHERWQLDFKEWMAVPDCGRVDVLTIRDEATPVHIASVVYAARTTNGRDIQQALRQGFTQWGLCDRLQTDRDKRLFNSQVRHPFPTVVLLWLAGLGIAHDIAPSAAHNGCVERAHRTWYERVVRGRRFSDLAHLQAISDAEVARLNHMLPSRGRNCQGQPPLRAYPEATVPRRPFALAQERQLFSLQRVYDYLAPQRWWRRVNTAGQASLGGHIYGIGRRFAQQEVCFRLDGHSHHWLVHTAEGAAIKQLPPKNLSADFILGL
jgi:transposase-like protein